MTSVYFKKFIAVGQRTHAMTSPFGEGHNIHVEVGFPLPLKLEEIALNAEMDRVLKEIDHRALGVDLDLGFEPETTALARWIFERLSATVAVADVRLIRGDGLSVRYFAQPSEGRSI